MTATRWQRLVCKQIAYPLSKLRVTAGQVQWCTKKVRLATRLRLSLPLECLGDWTFHAELEFTFDTERLSRDPKFWEVVHAPTGRIVARARDAESAKRVVEFLATRWPSYPQSDPQTGPLICDALKAARESGQLFFYFPKIEEEADLLRFEARVEECDLAEQLIAALKIAR